MLRANLRSALLICLSVAIITAAVLIARQGTAQTSAIQAEAAVNLALSYASNHGPAGGLEGQPTSIYRRLMPYGEAVQYIFKKPIEKNDTISHRRDNLVWLMVIHGSIVTHIPAAPPDIPAKDLYYNQMAVVIDATTGELIEEVLIPPEQELSVTSFQPLAAPAGPVLPAPTRGPIATQVPFPTQAPMR